MRVGLPRGIPAASLKRVGLAEPLADLLVSSAGNTRGLIEASIQRGARARDGGVFRGEYPRPH